MPTSRTSEVFCNMNGILDMTRQAALIVLLTGAMFCDLRYRIVPNLLVVLSVIVGAVLLAFEGFDALLRTILLALIISYPFYHGFQRGLLGGGDVKLVAAITIMAGEQLAKTYFLVGAMGGGLVSLIALILDGRKNQLMPNSDCHQPQKGRQVVVPYAAAYSAAILVAEVMRFLGG